MTHRTGVLSIAVAVWGAVHAASIPAQTPPSDTLPTVALPGELDRVLRDYERAWRARDPAALAALFTEDGFVLSGGRPPVRGRAAVQERYTGAGGPLHLRAIAYAADDTIGYIIGTYGATADRINSGKFVLALRRAPGGRWLIAADMDNGNQSGPPPAATIASAPDRFVTVGNAALRYRVAGRGEPVVLIHGLTRTLGDWIGIGDSLARDHRVIALDLRGHGHSTRFTQQGDFGIAFVDDVIALLDHLGIRRAHLVGHSLGAAIAAKAAQRHPDRIASISLIAGGFDDDTSAFARNQHAFAEDVAQGRGLKRLIVWLFPGVPDSAAAALDAQVMAANAPAAVAATMRSTEALVLDPAGADAIRVPALVAVGSRDPLLPNSRWLAGWWPEARLVVAEDADHLSVLQHPEVLAAIRQLIRREGSP